MSAEKNKSLFWNNLAFWIIIIVFLIVMGYLLQGEHLNENRY